MLTLDDAIDNATEKEHNENMRKLAAIVMNCDKICEKLETEISEIEDYMQEARKVASANAFLTEPVITPLWDKAHKLRVVPIDPMTREIKY